jgi:hypothetical protein
MLPKTMDASAQTFLQRLDSARSQLIDWMRNVFGHLGNNRIVRLSAVVGIYVMSAFLFLRRFGVTDVDIW